MQTTLRSFLFHVIERMDRHIMNEDIIFNLAVDRLAGECHNPTSTAGLPNAIFFLRLLFNRKKSCGQSDQVLDEQEIQNLRRLATNYGLHKLSSDELIDSACAAKFGFEVTQSFNQLWYLDRGVAQNIHGKLPVACFPHHTEQCVQGELAATVPNMVRQARLFWDNLHQPDPPQKRRTNGRACLRLHLSHLLSASKATTGLSSHQMLTIFHTSFEHFLLTTLSRIQCDCKVHNIAPMPMPLVIDATGLVSDRRTSWQLHALVDAISLFLKAVVPSFYDRVILVNADLSFRADMWRILQPICACDPTQDTTHCPWLAPGGGRITFYSDAKDFQDQGWKYSAGKWIPAEAVYECKHVAPRSNVETRAFATDPWSELGAFDRWWKSELTSTFSSYLSDESKNARWHRAQEYARFGIDSGELTELFHAVPVYMKKCELELRCRAPAFRAIQKAEEAAVAVIPR